MKKIFMVAIILMVGVGAAMAQKGEKAVGINVNYGSEISNVGFGAKFQYGITDAIRVEPSFDYYLEKDGVGFWDINVNFHYMFDVAENIKVYPLAGLGYANCKYTWSFDDIFDYNNYSAKTRYDLDDFYEDLEDIYKGEGGEESSSDGEIAVNIGVGGEYQLNEKFSIGAELKYQIINNFNQVVFGVGATYKF